MIATKPRRVELCLVLHAHLPYVRHPEQPRWLEEDWLFEAVVEVYLPLLDLLERLERERIATPLALSLSPTLVAMWADPLLRERTLRYLEARLELAASEVERTALLPELAPLAREYLHRFRRAREQWLLRHEGDLGRAFRELATRGRIELLTSSATHAFMPFLLDSRLWRAQVACAVAQHTRSFGIAPRGFWLPECGYQPGIDRTLRAEGLDYTFVETHGLLLGRPRPTCGVSGPVRTPGGIAVFARDPGASRPIWSAEDGYPGQPVYRDFHRDIGWDLDHDYLARWLHGDGRRSPLGIKYWSVSGRAAEKDPYDFDRAAAEARRDARVYLRGRAESVPCEVEALPPLQVAPFDAELFGHWWYEGPVFLESMFREAARAETEVALVTPSARLKRESRLPVVQPTMSSWGEHGYGSFWCARENDWVHRHLDLAGHRMLQLAERARRSPPRDELERRALTQAARELLLAQASDWPFILKGGPMRGYAERRIREHLGAFLRLYDAAAWNRIDVTWLAHREARTPIFEELDWRLFLGGSEPLEPERRGDFESRIAGHL